MKQTCKQVLLDFLKENEGYHKKVFLYSVAEDWSPETVGRDLRDLSEEGKIKTDFYDGKRTKHLAMYAIGDYQQPKMKYETIERDGKIIYQIT
jgi:hypothetical protein